MLRPYAFMPITSSVYRIDGFENIIKDFKSLIFGDIIFAHVFLKISWICFSDKSEHTIIRYGDKDFVEILREDSTLGVGKDFLIVL